MQLQMIRAEKVIHNAQCPMPNAQCRRRRRRIRPDHKVRTVNEERSRRPFRVAIREFREHARPFGDQHCRSRILRRGMRKWHFESEVMTAGEEFVTGLEQRLLHPKIRPVAAGQIDETPMIPIAISTALELGVLRRHHDFMWERHIPLGSPDDDGSASQSVHLGILDRAIIEHSEYREYRRGRSQSRPVQRRLLRFPASG